MNLFALLLSFFASISTLLGFFLTFVDEKYKDFLIGSSLSLAAGVMISVSFFSLLPEAFGILYLSSISKVLFVFFFFMLGFFLASILAKGVSSDGKMGLFQLGLLSFFTLVFHNVPEGILSYLTTSHSFHLGITVVMAILFHNIPEGLLIAVSVYYSSGSRLKAFLYTFVAGFSEFMGAFITALFLSNFVSFSIMGILFSATAGIMVYLSIFELLPHSSSYQKENVIFSFVGVGMLLMILCLYLL